MGCEHIANIVQMEDAEVVALSDPSERSLKWGLKAAGKDLPTFADHKDMIGQADLDGVVICSPNHTHASVLEAVFETDLHVLCEKPFATTFDDVKRLTEKAEEHKGLFWVGMEYRYMPPVARFIEEVRGGSIGALKMLSIREHRMPFLKKVGDWNRHSVNTGGTLVEKCCHYFDMMRLVTGSEPRRVFASGGQDVNHLDEVYDGKPADILDNAFVIVDFDNGVRAMHDLCMFAEASQDHEEMVAAGDEGKIECKIPTSDLIIGRRDPKSVERVHIDVPQEILALGYHHGATWHQHKALMKAVRNGTEAEVTALDGLKAVAMGLAAHRSIDERRPVDMSEFGL
jgi:predicted dehydrogenase